MLYKVVIQLTGADEGLIKKTTAQIKNLHNALPGNVQAELVCHGQSISFVTNQNQQWTSYLNELLQLGVKIVACENMLHTNNISNQNLHAGVLTVPAAIAELVIKQQEGWSYIKAGD